MQSTNHQVKDFLDLKVATYNQPGFIVDDPITIPHGYSLKQDIEITGFWAAILAWGQRSTIISKCKELFVLMDNAPYDFVRNHGEEDLKPLLRFKHRTSMTLTHFTLSNFSGNFTKNTTRLKKHS